MKDLPRVDALALLFQLLHLICRWLTLRLASAKQPLGLNNNPGNPDMQEWLTTLES